MYWNSGIIPPMEKYLTLAVSAAKKAGIIQMKYLNKPKRVKPKGIIDFVTNVDIACEKLICKEIYKKYPHHDILTEEKVCKPRSGTDKRYRWVVDPLDGTINYMHGLSLFSISIALEINKKLQVGVVYNPALNECFTVVRGKGAYCNGKKIHVSRQKDLIKSLLVTGFAYNIRNADNTNLENFARVSLKAQGTRRLGSAAIDLAYVACGKFEGFWELYLNPWDKAAGSLLVEEAGGKVTGFKDNSFNLYSKEILATNNKIHHSLQRLLR